MLCDLDERNCQIKVACLVNGQLISFSSLIEPSPKAVIVNLRRIFSKIYLLVLIEKDDLIQKGPRISLILVVDSGWDISDSYEIKLA